MKRKSKYAIGTTVLVERTNTRGESGWCYAKVIAESKNKRLIEAFGWETMWYELDDIRPAQQQAASSEENGK